MKKLQVIIQLALICALAGCSPASPAATKLAMTALPTETSTPQPTATLLPTLTPIPTLTATPTNTPFPTPTMMPEPTLLPAHFADGELQALDSVCLSVSQSGDSNSQPVAETASSLLQVAGIQVREGTDCEAQLSIELSFRAIGDTYTNGSTRCFVYTAAQTSGVVRLSAPGGAEVAYPFDEKFDPPNTWPSCDQSTPGSAPFLGQWTDMVVEGLTDLWGPAMLAYALEVENLHEAALSQINHLDEAWIPAAEPEITPALLRVLYGPDEKAHEYALQAMQRFPSASEAAIPFLLSIAQGHSRATGDAIDTLGKLGPQAAPAVPALIDLLKRKPGLEDNIGRTLGRIGPAAAPAVPTLLEIIESRPDVYHMALVDAFSGIGPEAAPATPWLVKMLEKNARSDTYALNDAVKVAKAIGNIGPGAKESGPAIVEILGREVSGPGDINPLWSDLQAQLILDLVRMGAETSAYLPKLAELMAPQDYSIDIDTHTAVVQSLGVMGKTNPQAVTQLVGLIDYKQKTHLDPGEVELAAYTELAKLGPLAVEAVPVFIDQLENNRRPEIHTAATSALQAVTGQGFGDDVQAWKKWWKANH